MLMMNRRELMAAFGALLASGVSAPAAFAQLADQAQTLNQLARKRGIILGVSADPQYLQVPMFADFIASNFDMITPGNQLKFGTLHPAQSVYNFTGADTVMKFAKANHMRVHGHNLCWDILNPGWVKDVVNKDNAREILEDHIHMVAGRYKGRIDSWDVVNEPIRVNAKRPDGLSTGPWLDALGPEYIDIAFQATLETDPKALRVLNLDNTEQASQIGDEVRRTSLQLVRDLVRRGVPVQAIGLESHLQTSFPALNPGRTKFIEQLRELGLEVLLTELDVDDTSAPGPDDARRAEVAKYYYDFLKDILPVSQAKRVIFWSFTDKDNWYDFGAKRAWYLKRADGEGHFPGLLTADGVPTPALAAVRAALA
jgi:endo-1,4-beta-xylanase